jgi:hypothetical protein
MSYPEGTQVWSGIREDEGKAVVNRREQEQHCHRQDNCTRDKVHSSHIFGPSASCTRSIEAHISDRTGESSSGPLRLDFEFDPVHSSVKRDKR